MAESEFDSPVETNPLALLSYAVRKCPSDLGLVVVLVAGIDVLLLFPLGIESPLLLAFEFLLILFLPGYTFVAVLFPRRYRPPSNTTGDRTTDRSIDRVERVGLSLGLSIALVPLIGLGLNFTSWGLRRNAIIASVSGFVVLFATAATFRRLTVPETERFKLDFEWIKRIQPGRMRQDSRIDIGLNLLLAVGIVLAASSVAYVLTVPSEGERYTEFYLLTDDGDELVLDDYPRQFERGEQRPVVLRVQNHEYETTRYTIVVEVRKLAGQNGTTTTEERELDRLRTPSIANNGSWTERYSIEPPVSGDRVELAFLLYRGAAPDDPTGEGAYRKVQLHLNVTKR